jgi:hypothetical protein
MVGNFVMFWGAMTMHHNQMLHAKRFFLSIGITSYLVKEIHLPCLEVSHYPPFHIINEVVEVVEYIIIQI